MASDGLTVKQEAFAQSYVETGNASEAYRRSYNASKSSPEAIWVEACRLLGSPKVALRVEQLQAEAKQRHDVTVDTIRDMLLADRELARQLETIGPAVTATMGLAKLYGLMTDKVEHKGGVTIVAQQHDAAI